MTTSQLLSMNWVCILVDCWGKGIVLNLDGINEPERTQQFKLVWIIKFWFETTNFEFIIFSVPMYSNHQLLVWKNRSQRAFQTNSQPRDPGGTAQDLCVLRAMRLHEMGRKKLWVCSHGVFFFDEIHTATIDKSGKFLWARKKSAVRKPVFFGLNRMCDS